MKTLLLATVAALATGAGSAEAATYTVTTIWSGYRVCQQLEAPDPKTAFQTCMRLAAWTNVPTWAVVVTAAQVCKSTHRVTQVAPNLLVRFAYDSQLSKVATPSCP